MNFPKYNDNSSTDSNYHDAYIVCTNDEYDGPGIVYPRVLFTGGAAYTTDIWVAGGPGDGLFLSWMEYSHKTYYVAHGSIHRTI